MSEYIITTDSDSYMTEASTADEAVARYAGRKGKGGPSTLADLVDHVEDLGGELTVTEDGAVIARVR